MYQRKDHFYKRAKKEGYASRAAYKLLEIQKKYKILKPGDTVLDLGCAPGGWLQVAAQIVGPKGKVIGIDRLPLKINPPANARFLQKNIEAAVQELPEADVILSDLSPDLSGIAFKDTYASFELLRTVWQTAQTRLQKGGNLVVKVFPGPEAGQSQKEMTPHFRTVKNFCPEATRKASSEVYLLAIGYKKQIG